MKLSEPNIERLLAAFRKQKHDRVPNFEIEIDPAMVRHIMGWGEDIQCSSWRLKPADAVEFAKRTYQDVIVIPMSWSFGRNICTWDDIEKIVPPEPSQYREKLKLYLDAVQGTNIGICTVISSPFFIVYMAVGPIPIQSFLLKLYDDLPFIERLMDIYLQHQINIFESIADLPISFVYIDDDVAMNSGFIVSPKMLEQIWIPRAEQLVKLVKQKDFPIEWHTCGKVNDLLPILVKWGIDAVHPMQPACNDIYAIKKQWGKDLCLIGNMNIEGILAFGSPEEVVADTKKHIDMLAYNGGYVVASSHSIVDAIPPENYFAMIETAQKHGKF